MKRPAAPDSVSPYHPVGPAVRRLREVFGRETLPKTFPNTEGLRKVASFCAARRSEDLNRQERVAIEAAELAVERSTYMAGALR